MYVYPTLAILKLHRVDPLKLVPDGSVDVSASLLDDLRRQDENNVLDLDENVPAYILVRDDGPPTAWLAMYYMPEYNVAQFDRVRVHQSLYIP